MRKTAVLLLSLSTLILWSCDVSVNRSQHLADGGRSSGMTTVNGRIIVGRDCTVDGASRTVNGRIEVGEGSRVKSLETVNGSIALGDKVTVDGDAATVNGSITCGRGSTVMGDISTINGSLELNNTAVSGGLRTTNGNIRLGEQSKVHGDIVIKGRRSLSPWTDSLEIRIEGGSMVEGGIDVRDTGRKVTVTISKDSSVRGEIHNAEVIKE
ncbi:MAG: hypothetical protein FJY83_05185 [Candidatus Aminicenantes bacterium]|nr:hypothetical protein [Candidatus Aminicenantes bacterium]